MYIDNTAITKQFFIRPKKILYFSIGAILSIVLFSGIMSYFWNINLITYLPDKILCLFHAFTGIPCPGCGMSRAFLLLGQLKIKEALQINLFSVPLLLLMTAYFTFGRIPSWLKTKELACITLFTVLFFWVVRLSNVLF